MKIQAFLKIAVVATAALAAYAFSGSASSPQQYLTFDANVNECTDLVLAECIVTGNEICRIDINGKIMELYDLGCNNVIKHNSSTPVNWN